MGLESFFALYFKEGWGNDSFLLSDMQMGQIRVLSGRQCCVKILESFSRMDGLCGKAMTCNSMTQVKKYITSLERCVLKAPWSGSGRGIMYVSSKEWNDSAEGWVSRVLRVQGEIMVEPLYNKVCDFAMEFYADGNGSVSFVGYSLFDTDAHGNYKGNFLLSDGHIKRFCRSIYLMRFLIMFAGLWKKVLPRC